MTIATTDAAVSQAAVPVYRPNALLRWILGRFFRHIDVDSHWVEGVQAAAKRGTVVYVMRSLSLLDFLCLDYLTKNFSLPLIRFVNELKLWLLGGQRRAGESDESALARTLEAQCSALLFLRKPPKLLHATRKGERTETDLVLTLVRAQRKSERPILLVPQTFIWGKLAGNHQNRIWDYLLGPVDWPGRLRTVFRFVFNYRHALLRTGDDFDLKAFLSANPELSDAEAADKVRYALLRRMERERTLVVGPRKKTPQRLREEIVKSPRLRHHIDALVRSSNRSVESVEAEVDKELKKLCAAPDEQMLGLLHAMLDRVWNNTLFP